MDRRGSVLAHRGSVVARVFIGSMVARPFCAIVRIGLNVGIWSTRSWLGIASIPIASVLDARWLDVGSVLAWCWLGISSVLQRY